MFEMDHTSTLITVMFFSSIISVIVCWGVWGRKLTSVERSLSSVGLVSGVRQRLLEHIDYERKVVCHYALDVQDSIALLRSQNEEQGQAVVKQMLNITDRIERLQARF